MTTVNVSSQVKMEYPFPPNDLAQRVQLWKEAKGFTELEDDINEEEDRVYSQMEIIYNFLCGGSEPSDQEKAIACWYLIAELCNLIRCYATRGDFNGELFGLNVLFRILSEE